MEVDLRNQRTLTYHAYWGRWIWDDTSQTTISMTFTTENMGILKIISLRFVVKDCQLSEVSIGSKNSLAPIWRQGISWSKADKDLRRKYAVLGLNVLTNDKLSWNLFVLIHIIGIENDYRPIHAIMLKWVPPPLWNVHGSVAELKWTDSVHTMRRALVLNAEFTKGTRYTCGLPLRSGRGICVCAPTAILIYITGSVTLWQQHWRYVWGKFGSCHLNFSSPAGLLSFACL